MSSDLYMTQDIGTAKLCFDDYPIDRMIYVVGNEQNYHFQVLSILLDKLGFAFGKGLIHFSYGMVELPEGKMKSREGTVVDADDLMDEMIATARDISNELGKLNGLSPSKADDIIHVIGYADGLDRHLSNGVGEVAINGTRCPIVGNICMDICMVDVTDADAQEGDTAIIFGPQLPVTEIADKLDTIPYEILTSISPRVKRIYYRE